MDASASVRLLGHPGRVRERVPHPPLADDAGWVWEGAVDGPGLARVLRHALEQGALPCDVDGVPHRVHAGSCWYDAATGVLVVELREPPRPVA